ncbi:hypothetical protein [Ligilactobacillus pobuzihii]|uniref:Uncharacterized protein n=1 Tax=Ligilactobacillus pobuzihii TaxID=449659 RepID=A0A0R2LTJ4_9LACO|nr:hypothetical protein [Ligilactobacillus pobuzihii]KRK11306.1 hypothetical protein FD11_GL000045 [Ligilactobacillus pobuzihii E100301 = KCTC 13174]KRO02621.1 hypothetical protein IV66_GL000045 [Ligilactobacillus pobuzihii]GEN47427.1 hypothetical protein LPO01_02190 [Ligilactobacillus pobuzihii]
MKFKPTSFLLAKVRFYFQSILKNWNDFFDPDQVLEQEQTPTMPAFQINSFIDNALKNQTIIKLNIQTGQHTEMIEGQLFEDHRHQDVYFMTTPHNKKLTRIVFKKQIVGISMSSSTNTVTPTTTLKTRTRLRKTS